MGVDPWTLGELNSMDTGLVSAWGFQESVEDLKQKLLLTTLELDALRTNAKEEIKKSEENISQLIQLLKIVTYERNEAREQVQFLVNRIKQQSGMFENPSRITQTRSKDQSGNHGHLSYVSSPVESFLDNNNNNVNSPEFSSVNKMADNNSYNLCSITQQSQQQRLLITTKHDNADAIIDCLALRKPLPEKGKFMQAVLDAGPLLQTSLLAGPLPRWRNPPPLYPLQGSALSVKSSMQCKPANLTQMNSVHSSVNHGNLSAVPQRCYNLPIRNFGDASTGLCVTTKTSMVSPFVANYAELPAKRLKS